jgi:hypothetical protein
MRSLIQLAFTFSSLAAITAGNLIRFFAEENCRTPSFGGCERIGEATCCFSRQGGKSVIVSKEANQVAVAFFEDFNSDNYCGISHCGAGGEGLLCCSADLAEYTGAAFYTIRSKMSIASAQEQKCTSTQEFNVFGVTLSDGQHLKIGHDEAKARSASFDELYEAFKKVASADAEAWLLKNGAVVVSDDGPITQTIHVVCNFVELLRKLLALILL